MGGPGQCTHRGTHPHCQNSGETTHQCAAGRYNGTEKGSALLPLLLPFISPVPLNLASTVPLHLPVIPTLPLLLPNNSHLSLILIFLLSPHLNIFLLSFNHRFFFPHYFYPFLPTDHLLSFLPSIIPP